jgi:hypothetical protein
MLFFIKKYYLILQVKSDFNFPITAVVMAGGKKDTLIQEILGADNHNKTNTASTATFVYPKYALLVII